MGRKLHDAPKPSGSELVEMERKHRISVIIIQIPSDGSIKHTEIQITATKSTSCWRNPPGYMATLHLIKINTINPKEQTPPIFSSGDSAHKLQ